MTAYHGGKQRIGKQLAEVIVDKSLQLVEDEGRTIKGYCEPFCGMLGVYYHIPALFKQEEEKLKYEAGDINKSVVMMWKKAQKGWVPPTKTTEAEYNRLWKSKDSALKGYIGHQYSFGGQFFNSYSTRYGKNPDSTAASNRVVKIAKELKDVTFYNKNYIYFSNLKGYVIYCDPPYEKSQNRYYEKHSKKGFDNAKFWDWCRKMSEHNIVFVSGYTAPKDFDVIYSSSHKLTGINTKKKKRVEKLYLV